MPYWRGIRDNPRPVCSLLTLLLTTSPSVMDVSTQNLVLDWAGLHRWPPKTRFSPQMSFHLQP